MQAKYVRYREIPEIQTYNAINWQGTRDSGKIREVQEKYDIYIDNLREIQAEQAR